MGGVCDNQRIMTGRKRVFKNVTLDNVSPGTLCYVSELLPRDCTRPRQFQQRSLQIDVVLQNRNEKRAGAAGNIENLSVAAEVIFCCQRRRARPGEGFHASRENLLFAFVEL